MRSATSCFRKCRWDRMRAFSEEAFVARYNSDLANDLGNMLSRAVKLTLRYFDGKIPRARSLRDD